MKKIDLTGRRYGKLLVIKIDTESLSKKTHWLCTCDCGNSTSVNIASLQNGDVKSCGKCRGEDLTGKVFGRLQVVGKSTLVYSDKHTRWVCKCECGNITNVVSSSLYSGNTQSCGCLRKDVTQQINRLDYGEAAFNSLIGDYKRSAKKRHLDFTLTREEFRNIVLGNCYYCGKEPSQTGNQKFYGLFIHNGIDRVDNSIGYTRENVVTCCKQCNQAKSNYTVLEFKQWINQILLTGNLQKI